MTDPIADMLTRIRHAQLGKKAEVVLPYSKIKYHIAKLLEKEGWLGTVEVLEPLLAKNIKAKSRSDKDAKFKQIRIEIKYAEGKPKINSLKRISKPGRRIYAGKDKMPVVCNNYGIAVISTPQGLLTNKKAKKNGLGGEIICEVF